jgi:phosphoglycolate phosphatase
VTTVLWDIDGTLLRAPGLGVRAFASALQLVAGEDIPRDRRYDFGGKTDPLIALELLVAIEQQHRAEELIPPMLAEVARMYVEFVEELRTTSVVLPGVPEALEAFAQVDARQSVVTGNIESVARCKLSAVGLDAQLDLDGGAYGSDHQVRSELVRLAMQRLGGHADVDPATTWVIGDTPRDATCAREAGVRCLLVATGTYSVHALREQGADAVLDDLGDTERVLSVLLAPSTARA